MKLIDVDPEKYKWRILAFHRIAPVRIVGKADWQMQHCNSLRIQHPFGCSPKLQLEVKIDDRTIYATGSPRCYYRYDFGYLEEQLGLFK